MTTKTIEQVQEDSEILAETNRNCLAEIATLKAQLADKGLVIAELNTVVNNIKHELKVQQGKASRQAEWDSSTIERKTRSINRKKQTIKEKEQALEDISRTAKIRLDNYNELAHKYDTVTSENASLRKTLKAVL